EKRLQQAEKMEAIGTLAGGIAHDLNNIISTMINYPEMVLLDLEPDSELIEPINEIKKSGEKVAAIVQDLLTLARRKNINKEIINLNSVVHEFVESLQFKQMLKERPNIKLGLELEEKTPPIMGAHIHLYKVIMNLLVNACEAMPKGGRVIIRTGEQYLNGSIKDKLSVKPGKYVTLQVQDTGIGIPESDIPHIFEPFFTKKSMGRSGTGLGMAIVWGTVKDHDGYIWVESKINEGTIFTIYLPVSEEKDISSIQNHPINSLMGNQEKILIIDDEVSQRNVATRLLMRMGYQVESVENGEEALKYLKTSQIDLIILDMILGEGMDGLETYQEILKLNPEQKVIIVSGFSQTERVKKALELGVYTYITKPYSMEKIGKEIKNCLKKAK
ncbi:MAG: response regulator, partial [Spirochaetes bacterium]|nr:response regulator [Spirochaetota bacterium]